jgi:hypothetical protein
MLNWWKKMKIKTIFGAFLAYWIFCALLGLGTLGFAIWAIIKVMQHFQVI